MEEKLTNLIAALNKVCRFSDFVLNDLEGYGIRQSTMEIIALTTTQTRPCIASTGV